jgi:AcrR family transcriptional regulator
MAKKSSKARPRPPSRSKPPSRRDADKEKRREAILEAATHLFAARGLENVTFGDVAKATGLSRPLIYFYFPDREALFFEAVARSELDLHSRFVTAVKPHLNGRDQIVAIGRDYLTYLRERPSCFQLMAAYSARKKADGRPDHPMETQIEEQHSRTMDMLTTTLARGIKEGVLRKDLGNLLQVAVCLWSFTHGLAQIIAVKGEHLAECHGLDPAATVETAFDLLTRALIPGRK